MLRVISFIAELAETTLIRLIQALLATIVAVIFAQVVFRYVLSAPLIWSEEIARLCFVWLTFLGAAILAHRGEHIAVALFGNRVSPRYDAFREVAWAVVGLCLFIIFILEGMRMIGIVSGQIAPATGLPIATLYLAAVVGGGFGAVLSVARAARSIGER